MAESFQCTRENCAYFRLAEIDIPQFRSQSGGTLQLTGGNIADFCEEMHKGVAETLNDDGLPENYRHRYAGFDLDGCPYIELAKLTGLDFVGGKQ